MRPAGVKCVRCSVLASAGQRCRSRGATGLAMFGTSMNTWPPADEPPGDVAKHRDRVCGVLEDMPQADDVGGLAGWRILEQAGFDLQPVRLPCERAERR